MYSKYEEMKVLQQVLTQYAANQKYNYEEIMKRLKESVKQSVPNIENGQRQANDFNSLTSLLGTYSASYTKAKGILSELSKAIMCFEMALTAENRKNGLAEKMDKEGKRLFYQLRTQNQDYKDIISEISYDLIVRHDEKIEGVVSMGTDAKIVELEQLYGKGNLSKEELIFYTIACDTLSTNPNFLEYASEFQNNTPPVRK